MKNPLLNRRSISYSIFSVLIGWSAQAQTCNTIAGGSYFEALYDDGRDFRDLSATKKIEPSCWIMTTPLPYAQNNTDFGTKKVYGVVDNPYNVNSAFRNIDDPMMLISGAGAEQSLFSYQLSGLTPSTEEQQYSIVIEGYFLNDASSPCFSTFQETPPNFNFKVTYSDHSSTSRTWTPWIGDSPQWEEKFTYSITRTLAAGETELNFGIGTGDRWGECLVLGISKIEIFYLFEEIPYYVKSNAAGNEVCKGEQVRFTLGNEYDATTYQWEKSSNNETWTPVGGNVKAILDEINATTWYRCLIDGVASEALKITVVNCCEVRPGVASSRKVIYHNNFGTFSSSTNYTDAFGNSVPARYWHACVPDMIPGHVCANAPSPWPGPGCYTIAAAGRRIVPWQTGVMYGDASDDPNGGALFIDINFGHSPDNPPYYGEIYKQQIDNICPNVNLYFEVSIANVPMRPVAPSASGDNSPNVTISILTTDGIILGEKRSNLNYTILGWLKVTIPPFVTSETSVILKIVSNNTHGWDDGVDLLMDDIIFRVCSPPTVELYSNLSTLTQDTVICDHSESNITLATQVSQLMSDYYNNKLRFLYQASINNDKAWKNISEIISESSYTHSFNNYEPGTYIYFRILVASENELNKFIDNPKAEDNTNCKTVSISDPIKIYVDDLWNGRITANTPICKDEIVTINAGYNANTYIWTSPAFDDEKEIALIIESPAETTTYNLHVSRGECEATDSVTIQVNTRPVILSIDSLGVRDKEIIPDPEQGTPPFKYGVDEEPADDNPAKYGLLLTKHSFYIIDALGCRSDTYTTEAPKLRPPAFFTPNGDGFNDTWEVPGMRDLFPDAVVSIYNRFGKLLIRYKGTDIGWDGTYMGRKMPATDYWYRIDVNVKEIEEPYIGHLTLLRR